MNIRKHDVDPTAAAHLAEQLATWHHIICIRVTTRLLVAYPELVRTLRMESVSSIEERLSHVSVARLYELVRAILIFDLPELADKELTWAHSVLSRSGVTYEHQSAMIRWFFEEMQQLGLQPDEQVIVSDLRDYMLGVLQRVFHVEEL